MWSWPDIQLGLWLVCIGVIACNAALSWCLCWARRRVASYYAVALLMLTMLVAMVCRVVMAVSDDDAVVMLASRSTYSAALLIPAPVMFLAALPLSLRLRWALSGATAVPALAPWIDPLVFSGGVVHSADTWGAGLSLGDLSPVAVWLVGYGPIVFAAVALIGRNAERDLRGSLVFATLVVAHALPLEVAIDAGLVALPRLAPIGLAVGSTAIIHVLLARVVEAMGALRVAQSQLAVQRTAANDEARRVARLAALGEAAMQLVAHIRVPVRRLAHDLDLLAEDVRLAAQAAHGPLDELADAMTDTRHDAARMRDTVSRVADFATADVSGEGSCQLRDCIDSAVDMLRNELRHQARLSIDAASEVMVRGNDARLTRLIMLAIRAGVYWATRRRKGGSVQVAVETRGDDVVVVIRCEADDGEVTGLAFDPYSEWQATHDGLGLDLATAHRLATAFGGSVRQVRAARGATLEVVLPREVAPT